MFDRKANNSVLFSLTRRKSIQFLGITVDPGFEIGGAQNARLSTRKFFSVPHSLLSSQPGLDTLESSKSMRWLKITILRLFVATAVNIKAFLMQEQGDCSFKHKNLAPFSN